MIEIGLKLEEAQKFPVILNSEPLYIIYIYNKICICNVYIVYTV